MSPVRTRIINLDAGQQREDAENTRTGIILVDQPAPNRSFQQLFELNYSTIRRVCTNFARPGVALVAIDVFDNKVAASVCVASKVGEPNSAIVGRHSIADLYLDSDPGLSLRHLAVILEPMSAGTSDVRFRVVDLRSSLAFSDEHDNKLEGIVAEGPVFIRVGNFALFCLPTGDPAPLPDDATDAWSCIPERVYLAEEVAEPDRWKRKVSRRKERQKRGAGGDVSPNAAITRVQSVRGPQRARTKLLAPGEDPIGTLRITTDTAVQSLVIGLRAARHGILVGRYERCDSDGATVLVSDTISRIHLLLVAIGGRMCAIDTASTNGTWAPGDVDVRTMYLSESTDLTLGEDIATLRWLPV